MLKQLTAAISAAYLRGNALPIADVSDLIRNIHAVLTKIDRPAEPVVLVPAVSIKNSIKHDRILCLECGKSQKMLKRHLQTAHDLGGDEYRTKWNLPSDYPLVASDYASKRSNLAKAIGLGRKKTRTANAEVVSSL